MMVVLVLVVVCALEGEKLVRVLSVSGSAVCMEVTEFLEEEVGV